MPLGILEGKSSHLNVQLLFDSLTQLISVRYGLEYLKKVGYGRIGFIGGEPSIYPEILELINHARDIGFDGMHIETNGRMFSYKNCYFFHFPILNFIIIYIKFIYKLVLLLIISTLGSKL